MQEQNQTEKVDQEILSSTLRNARILVSNEAIVSPTIKNHKTDNFTKTSLIVNTHNLSNSTKQLNSVCYLFK